MGFGFDSDKAIRNMTANILRHLRLKVAVKPLFTAGECRAIVATFQGLEAKGRTHSESNNLIINRKPDDFSRLDGLPCGFA